MHKQIILIGLLVGLAFGQTLPDINRNTQGTLNINRGGTGATSAASALSNLGGISATSTDSLSNKTLINPKINAILDPSNGSVVLQIQSITGATEGITISPATSGNPPEIASFGSGSNVDLLINPKGNGLLQLPIAAQINIADGTVGYMLTKGATGLVWAPVGSGGTVQSVNVSGVSGIFTFSGGPVTTSGIIGMSLDSQTANKVFVSPDSISGAPTFRSLVDNDIPGLDTSKISSGTFVTARVVNGAITPSRCLELNSGGSIVVASAACNTSSSGVTSVGVSGISGVLSVSGSPVTSAGTIALSLDTQTANKFLASPSAGSGTPSMRIIVAADIPVLDASKITTGVLGAARVINGALTAGACAGLDGSLNIVGVLCGSVYASPGTTSGTVATWTSTDRTLSAGVAYGAGSLGSTIMYRNASNQTGVGTLFVDSVIFSGTSQIANTLTADVPGLDITAYSAQTLPLVRFFGPGGTPLLSYIDSVGRFPATKLVGVVPAANLGTGTADNTTVLYGDGVFRSAASCATCVTAASALTANRIVLGDGLVASKVMSSAGTSGQLLTSAGASEPTWTTKTDAATASTVVSRDAQAGFVVRDSGGQVWNVLDFSGVDNTGSNASATRAGIQSALDTCQNSTYGGIVYFPPGLYATDAELLLYNGSGNTESTKKPCTLNGAGGGVDYVRTGTSTIRWTGSAPGSPTQMLRLQGPMWGGGINNLSFDTNNKANLRGVYMDTITHLNSTHMSIVGYTTTALTLTVTSTTSSGPGYGACDNTFTHLRIGGARTGGSGILLDGYDGTNGMDACSNSFYNPLIVHDGATSGTYGVKLRFADNNRFYAGNIYAFPSGSQGSGILMEPQSQYTIGTATVTSGSNAVTGFGTGWTSTYNGMPFAIGGKVYTISTVNSTTSITLTTTASASASGTYYIGITQFPHENLFSGITTHNGILGSSGYNGVPNVFLVWNTGDCSYNCDPFTSLQWYTKPMLMGSERQLQGFTSQINVGGSTTSTFFDAQDLVGTSLFKIQRNSNQVDVSAFENIKFAADQGIIPSNARTHSQLGSWANGTLIYCSDCTIANPCGSGGTGAIAKRLNSTWVCN